MFLSEHNEDDCCKLTQIMLLSKIIILRSHLSNCQNEREGDIEYIYIMNNV